jgi:hypothetical protein
MFFMAKRSFMKWIALTAAAPTVRIFNLVDNNQVKEVLQYNTKQSSVRLLGTGGQRVFFMEQPRFRNNYFVVKNEYGFETARINSNAIYHRNDDTGEQERMQYSLNQHPVPELVIYGADGLRPLAVCSIPEQTNEQPLLAPDTRLIMPQQACLLWGFHWYLQNTPAIELNAGAGLSLA